MEALHLHSPQMTACLQANPFLDAKRLVSTTVHFRIATGVSMLPGGCRASRVLFQVTERLLRLGVQQTAGASILGNQAHEDNDTFCRATATQVACVGRSWACSGPINTIAMSEAQFRVHGLLRETLAVPAQDPS